MPNHPFDNLEFYDEAWEGSGEVPAFQDCDVNLVLHGVGDRLFVEEDGDEAECKVQVLIHVHGSAEPTATQRTTYDWVVGHAVELRPLLFKALVSEVHRFCKSAKVKIGNHDVTIEMMPRLLSLNTVRVFAEQEDGLSLYSLAFECGWDIEHGVEVLCSKFDIRQIGGTGTVWPV